MPGVRLGAYVFAPRLGPSLAAAVLLPILVGLGVWQLGRAEAKARVVEEYARRAADAPLRLEASHADPQAMAHRRVTAHGRYRPERQFLLDNRTLRSRPGYHVLTPLELEGAQAAVLVNRGWVPLGATREALPDVDVDAGPRSVEGVLRVPGPQAPMLGPQEVWHGWPRVVQRLDLDALAAQLGTPLLPFTLELAPQEPDGFAREWRPLQGIGPEKHRAYALQWFSLAILLALLYVTLNTRRVPDPAGHRDTP